MFNRRDTKPDLRDSKPDLRDTKPDLRDTIQAGMTSKCIHIPGNAPAGFNDSSDGSAG